MNKFIARAQELGKKATEIKHAVEALPAQAARLRAAVTMTGGELQQLRSDVQNSIHGLKADSEERLLKSMREINDHASIFEEAGYDLNGMDLDLALNQRLAVHLDKFEDVPHAILRTLLGKQTSEAIRSILAGIIKAEETAANVELSHLKYRGLVVHVGPLPTIRMRWRDEVVAHPEVAHPEEQPAVAHVAPSAPPPPSKPPIPAPEAPAAPASMFNLRPLPSGTVRIESKPAPSSAPPSRAASSTPSAIPSEPAKSSSSSWSYDALERFKKMPGVSKYGK